MTEEEAYAILGVSPGASATDVAKAYRRLVLKWHPDKCQSPEAADRFREIRAAYLLLKRERGSSLGIERRGEAHSCPVCQAPPGSRMSQVRLDWDEFWEWLSSDSDEPDLYWVFDLCDQHNESVLQVRFPWWSRDLDRAERVMNAVATAHSVSSWLENATWRFMQLLMLIAAIALLVGVAQSCS